MVLRVSIDIPRSSPPLRTFIRIVVRGNGNVAFHYFVNGVRRGYTDLELIRENHAYVPEERGVPYGTQYPGGHRRILIENGTLNPDFTPNEQTATRMGWTLRSLHDTGRVSSSTKAERVASNEAADKGGAK